MTRPDQTARTARSDESASAPNGRPVRRCAAAPGAASSPSSSSAPTACVVSAAVIGLPDPDLGAKAHAIVEVAPGHDLPEPAELAAFLAPRLSRHKLPYTCEFVTAPLRDEAGKVRRTRLREERLEAPRASYLRLR